MQEKYKYLLKNIGLFSISNIGGRIISFFLLPLYTNILKTSEYGTYDFYVTTISLVTPFLLVCIGNAVLRFSLDKNEDKTDTFTVGFQNLFRGIVIFAILILINYTFKIIPILNEYPLFLFLYFVSNSLYSLLTNCARGLDKVAHHAFSGLINTISAIVLNILFLVVFKLGIKGYFLAYILAYFISSAYLLICLKMHSHLRFRVRKKTLRKDMEKYSRAFILNSVAWWVNSVSDRYVIIWLCGTSANGIYSIAYKIPSIINALEAIFEQAWTLSAIKEYDNENKDFYSDMYKLYNFGMIMACSALIVLDKPLAKFLYAKDFYEAWKYVPFLIISILFGSLGGFIGGIFSAAKKSAIFAQTTLIGALINVIFNIVLVYYIGPLGAAISTMISYFVVWVCRMIKSRQFVKLNINIKRDAVAYLILLLQSVLLISIKNNLTVYLIEAVCVLVLPVMYFRECKIYYYKFINTVKRIKGGSVNETD